MEAVYTPVEGVEIYEVIRKRLFDDFGDENIRKEVAQTYFDLYQKRGTDVPADVKEIDYRERIEHAYPFHPELIDVLHERWGSYPTFQRTRGVLRLLAHIVADQYKQRVVSPLIQSSFVNLENQAIRREFIKHIGNEFDSVIAADVAGKSAKAPKIDKEMGSEYEKYAIASGIATSVFLYSFSGAERKGTTVPWIRVALLREGIPHTIVGDAIVKLEEELWYFHSGRKQYSFKNRPNLKLAILSPEFLYDSEKGKKLVTEVSEKAGIGFRVYKNILFSLAMDDAQYVTLSNSLKRFLALSDIQSDKGLLETLTRESQDELKKKLKEAEKEIAFRILSAYRHLALLEESGLDWKDLGIPTVGTSVAISDRVKQYLKDQERILSRLTPKYIIERTFAKDENEKALRDINELFLKTPGMPIIENEVVLFDAGKEGVRSGFIGVREGSEVYYKQDSSPTIDSVILRGEVAERLKLTEEKGKEESGGIREKGGVYVAESKKTEDEGTKRVTLRAKVPWDKLSSIRTGVIGPLKDKGQEPEITIEIKAETEEKFDRTTLDTRVKETLQQIGAEIEEWKEE